MPDADPFAMLRSRSFLVLLVLAAVVGLGVSLAAWGFLELIHQIQVGVFTKLPDAVGYDHGAPLWWSLPFLAVAVVRLPGHGGHVPADGLQASGPEPVDLPGILLAAFGTIGLGVVLGPEAPLIALGGGLGALALKTLRRDAPEQAVTLVAGAGTFAAVSLIFASPLIAAVLLLEIAGLSAAQLKLMLVPGLLAAGIGSLVSIGMGSFTGLSTSAYALDPLELPHFSQPTAAEFGWTIPLAVVVTVVCFLVFRLARRTRPVVETRPFLTLPLAGLVVGGLAIAFHGITGHGVNAVLFDGQNALGPLTANAGAWSLGALALLLAFKGVAWAISLAGFRGGPTFPALFLGAAGGLMASHLPGMPLAPAVGVGMAAGIVGVLRLPLTAVILGVLLTSSAGVGLSPLIIVGVVVATVTDAVLQGIGQSRGEAAEATTASTPSSADGEVPAPAGAK